MGDPVLSVGGDMLAEAALELFVVVAGLHMLLVAVSVMLDLDKSEVEFEQFFCKKIKFFDPLQTEFLLCYLYFCY